MNFNGRFILDEHGEPQPCEDLLTWGAWFETSGDARRVALDEVGPYRISTVFLGLDHSWTPMEDPLTYQPVLWETAIFAGDSMTAMRRYVSRADALRGHREFIKILQQAPAEGSRKF